jgi:hypothetical protein
VKRSPRRWLLVIAGGVMTSMAISSAWQTANADTPVNFGSYTISSTAPGFEMWEDEPSANAHPEGGGQAPYSTAALGSGGVGYGLSSVAWPGATEANVDKVALLLFPHDVTAPNGPTVPVPDAVIGLFETAAPAANYPIRAESRTGTGTPDSSFDAQGATLKAHADPALAQGTASMKGATGQAGFSFGNAETIATSRLSGTDGQATADSRISNIDVGGVIKIESVTSNATATTDGVASSSSGLTVVQGMTIAGQKAYVDEQGVHIGEQGQPANAIVSQIANQALTNGGFSFYVSQPQQEQSGATSSYTAGSLYILWKPPSNPAGNVFLIALGGSRVSVTAAPGSAFRVPSLPLPSAPSPSGASPGTPSRPGIASAPATSGTPVDSKTTPAPSVGGRPIAATFDGLGGQAVLALLGSGLMFFGFRRVADDIVDRAPSSCPLETT